MAPILCVCPGQTFRRHQRVIQTLNLLNISCVIDYMSVSGHQSADFNHKMARCCFALVIVVLALYLVVDIDCKPHNVGVDNER